MRLRRGTAPRSGSPPLDSGWESVGAIRIWSPKPRVTGQADCARGQSAMPNVTIETDRLYLRRLGLDDADLLLEIFSDPIAMQYYESTRDRDQTVGWIRWNLEMYEQHGHGMWAAFERDGNRFVGQVGLVVQEVEGRTETELGYLLRRSCWGRGFATEAARGCRDYGFRDLHRDRLISLIDLRNEPSRRVAARVGMRIEREIRKWGKAVCVYALARDTPIVEAG
jgi:RimJ/RimL family protein N-acetyltransferase